MYEADELLVPNSADDEAKAAPIVSGLAGVIGAITATDGFISPARFEAAMSVAETIGKKVGEPSLTRVLVLRALISPRQPWATIADLKLAAASLPVAERAAVMHELARLIEGDSKLAAKGFMSELSRALEVRPPGHATRDVIGVFDALGSLGERAIRLVRSESPLFAEAREFAADFNDSELLTAIHAGDKQVLFHSLGRAVDAVRRDITAVSGAAEAAAEALSIAQQFDDAADQIERVARQRYASVARRA